MNANSRNLVERKAVAPIIATLLMVAIAVVGGILIFVFTQGFFNSNSVQGPAIDSIQIYGYDFSDANALTAADGFSLASVGTGKPTGKFSSGDPFALYVRNTGTAQVILSKIILNGGTSIKPDTTAAGTAFSTTVPASAKFAIQQLNTTNTAGNAIIGPGQEATIVGHYDGLGASSKSFTPAVGKNIQVQVVTANGAIQTITAIYGTNQGQ